MVFKPGHLSYQKEAPVLVSPALLRQVRDAHNKTVIEDTRIDYFERTFLKHVQT